MARENEIKIKLQIQFDDFIKRVEKYGFKKEKEIEQEDIYFDTEGWDLYDKVSALRIRKANGKDKDFTYKKLFHLPNKENKWHVEELEVNFPIQNNEDIQEIFKTLKIEYENESFENSNELISFLKENRYPNEQVLKKTRTIYEFKDNELVIDNIEELGVIIELESKESDPQKIIDEILKKNEWERSVEGTHYMFLEKKFGFTKYKYFTKMFEKEPDWNVEKGQREIYETLNN